jgi:hypothetical protein
MYNRSFEKLLSTIQWNFLSMQTTTVYFVDSCRLFVKTLSFLFFTPSRRWAYGRRLSAHVMSSCTATCRCSRCLTVSPSATTQEPEAKPHPSLWRPRFLMTESTGSNLLTLVKPWSTWVITSKPSQQSLMTLLIKSTPTCGQPLVKTPVKPLCLWTLSGTFATFSKFHLNTLVSPNIKVVQFFEGHNFAFGWHFKFWVEKGEKAWSTPSITIHRH